MGFGAACLFLFILIIAGGIAIAAGGLVFVVGSIAERKVSKRHGASPWSLLIAFLATPIICATVFWAWTSSMELGPPSPRQEPADQDLVGEWRLSEPSSQFVQTQGYTLSTSSLSLRADHTFTMIDMPHLVTYVGKNGEYTSDSGTWFLEKDITGNWDVGIRFNEPQYLAEKSTTTRAYFNIRGQEPPYTLYKYYGDPDEGFIITLERH